MWRTRYVSSILILHILTLFSTALASEIAGGDEGCANREALHPSRSLLQGSAVLGQAVSRNPLTLAAAEAPIVPFSFASDALVKPGGSHSSHKATGDSAKRASNAIENRNGKNTSFEDNITAQEDDWQNKVVKIGIGRFSIEVHEDNLPSGEILSLELGLVLFFVSICCLGWAGPKNQFNFTGESHDQEVEICRNGHLEEDTYGLAVSVLVRDSAVMAVTEGSSLVRYTRFLLVFMLVFVNMSLQVFLLFQVLHLVTPPVVNNLRKYYDKFEWHMYGQNMSHFTLASDGTRRGIPEFFQPELFKLLDFRTKKEVCHVPFSQPLFFIVILFIWTLTCMGELRKCLEMFRALVVATPTVTNLSETLEPVLESPEPTKKLVVGLTWQMKAFVGTILVLPRAFVTIMLLWLGSRWLAGTNDFGDLIMNTVALEFVLQLQYLLYMSVVPSRNKRDCQHILILPHHKYEPASLGVFASSFSWLLVSLLWALLYTYYFQNVLPGYNWDVRDICAEWLWPHGSASSITGA